jgi:hypothetical protein
MPYETLEDRGESIDAPVQPEEGMDRRVFLGLSWRTAAGAVLASAVPGFYVGSKRIAPRLPEWLAPPEEEPLQEIEPHDHGDSALVDNFDIDRYLSNLLEGEGIVGEDGEYAAACKAMHYSPFRPAIERASGEFGLDSYDLMATAAIESGLDHYDRNGRPKVSESGAFGMMGIKPRFVAGEIAKILRPPMIIKDPEKPWLGEMPDPHWVKKAEENPRIREILGYMDNGDLEAMTGIMGWHIINVPFSNILFGAGYKHILGNSYSDGNLDTVNAMYYAGPTNYLGNPDMKIRGDRYAKRVAEMRDNLMRGDELFTRESRGFDPAVRGTGISV